MSLPDEHSPAQCLSGESGHDIRQQCAHYVGRVSEDTDDGADLPEQLRIRRAKYDRLMADPQRAPFPVAVPRTTSLAEVRAKHHDLGPDVATGEQVGVTGRVIFVRNTGKLCFARLREGDAELQAMLSLDRVGADSLAAWKADVDLGDLVFVHGEVISSKRGELSVLADDWRITAKALRPLPVAHKPMSDENRIRERYVDLIVRPDARKMVTLRSQVLNSLRTTLTGRGYVEVETPILQNVHGGAAARPFHTHLNAFDLQMSLRIATELFLKRCVVGGIERVFEMGPAFRNEGIDSSHSPEYTLLEAYEAYGDYDTMAELTRALILDAAAAVGVEQGTALDGAPHRAARAVAIGDDPRRRVRRGGRARHGGHFGRGPAPACRAARDRAAAGLVGR